MMGLTLNLEYHHIVFVHKLALSLLYRSSFLQIATEAQIVDAGMKVFRNPINVNWR